MYKNIIFDLGNVVLNYNPEEYLIKKINDKNKVEIALNNIFKSPGYELHAPHLKASLPSTRQGIIVGVQ